jgi:hypothetical protein
MTDIIAGDYVEWGSGRVVYRILSTSGEMAEIGRKLRDTEKVYSVRKIELHLIDRQQAEKILAINDAKAQAKEEYDERNESLLRQWGDQWELIHSAREKREKEST